MLCPSQSSFRTTVHAVILAGGRGKRLGGVSKADIMLSGRRVLDIVLEAAAAVADGRMIVVAPDSVVVPDTVTRTLEDPPAGGPVAGIGAGIAELEDAPPCDLVLILAVDTPGAVCFVSDLVEATSRSGLDGAVVVGGAPEPFIQRLQACYRLGALRRALALVPPHGCSVHRALGVLKVAAVHTAPEFSQDIDTWQDVVDWHGRVQP